MTYNIVTNRNVLSDIKKSRHFKQNLGVVSTVEKNGSRVLNERDQFAFRYNTQYKTTISCQGNIGDIMVYIDHYIKEDVLALYYDVEEFIFNHDKKIIEEKGADFYIGHLIKQMEEQYEDRVRVSEEKKVEEVRKGDPNVVINNPGAATFEDIQAYLAEKAKNRYSVQSDLKKE